MAEAIKMGGGAGKINNTQLRPKEYYAKNNETIKPNTAVTVDVSSKDIVMTESTNFNVERVSPFYKFTDDYLGVLNMDNTHLLFITPKSDNACLSIGTISSTNYKKITYSTDIQFESYHGEIYFVQRINSSDFVMGYLVQTTTTPPYKYTLRVGLYRVNYSNNTVSKISEVSCPGYENTLPVESSSFTSAACFVKELNLLLVRISTYYSVFEIQNDTISLKKDKSALTDVLGITSPGINCYDNIKYDNGYFYIIFTNCFAKCTLNSSYSLVMFAKNTDTNNYNTITIDELRGDVYVTTNTAGYSSIDYYRFPVDFSSENTTRYYLKNVYARMYLASNSPAIIAGDLNSSSMWFILGCVGEYYIHCDDFTTEVNSNLTLATYPKSDTSYSDALSPNFLSPFIQIKDYVYIFSFYYRGGSYQVPYAAALVFNLEERLTTTKFQWSGVTKNRATQSKRSKLYTIKGGI